jgi:hypothetical protein
MDTRSVSSSGPLSQQMQVETAKMSMLKKHMDAQGKAALQIIEASTATTATGDVGRLLNITA